MALGKVETVREKVIFLTMHVIFVLEKRPEVFGQLDFCVVACGPHPRGRRRDKERQDPGRLHWVQGYGLGADERRVRDFGVFVKGFEVRFRKMDERIE